MLLKCAQITIQLHIILNLLLQQLVSDTILPVKFTFYGRVLKSIACVALVREAAGERRTAILFQILRSKKIINGLVVTSNKLTNNFGSLVTSGLGPDVPCGPPV
jgi:hypothetical protein